jgi:transcriptional repressor NrdR
MQCPYCDFEDTKVIDSRLSETKDAVRRRRECLSPSCGKRFTTYERREPLRLMVIKRDGGKEPFDREKLRSGMTKACAKQQVTDEQVDLIVDEIEAELRECVSPARGWATAGRDQSARNRKVKRANAVME